jgi:hemin uptake protein HemP
MSSSDDWSPARSEALPPLQGVPHDALPARPPLVDSRELLRGHRSVEIHHNGELYRLQSTRTGKLILTK